MEIKRQKMAFVKAGGSAGKKAVRVRIDIPPKWVEALGADNVEMVLDDGEIRIRKRLPYMPEAMQQEAIAEGHDVKMYGFFDAELLCSKICVDLTARQISVQNQVQDITKTAFGINEKPTWKDWLAFLEDRCIPRTRVGLQEYLRLMGLDSYDPFEMVQVTQGRMQGDDQWLKEI